MKRNRYFSTVILLMLTALTLQCQINVRTHYMRGRQQLASHEFTEAIRTFNTILQYNPDHADALFYRGLAKYQLSDYKGAEVDFNRSIEIKPYKTEVLYYRALLKVQRNQYLDAFRDVQKAIELDDRHPEYFITRGWLHLEYGDTAGAIQDYKKSIDLDSFLDNAHLNLSNIYMHQGKFKLALLHCDSAAAINPYNPGCQLTRGNIFKLQENYSDAIVQFEEVLVLDSLNVRAWYFLALCHQELNSYDAALNAYNRTIELNRNNALAYYNRGLLQIEQNNYVEALADFDQAVRLNPKNIYTYYIRGIIKTRMEDYEGAEQDFSAAIDLYPGLIHAYRDRSVIRMVRNDMKGYAEDRNTVDSLLNIQVPGFDLSEINYLKTITGFNADFTPVERVMGSKVQYAEEGVHMISMFEIRLRPDQYDQSYRRVDDLTLPETAREPLLLLELNNYLQCLPDEITLAQIEEINKSLPGNTEKLTENEVLLKSLIMGWHMKFRDAINILDESDADLSGNYLAAFIRGNHNLAIAEIIESIENQNIQSFEGNPTIATYYQNALEDYNRSIVLNPEFPYSWFNRAYVYSMTDNLERALSDYLQSIELDQNLAEAYFNMGLLKIFMDSPSDGCQHLSKAGELGVKAAYQVIYKFCKDE